MRKTDIHIYLSWSVAFRFSFPFALLRDLSPLHCIGDLLTWQDKTSGIQSNASHWSPAAQPNWDSGFPVLIWLYIKHFQLSTQNPSVASKRISVSRKCYISLLQFTHNSRFFSNLELVLFWRLHSQSRLFFLYKQVQNHKRPNSGFMKSHLPISLQKTIKISPFMRNLAANVPQERRKSPSHSVGAQTIVAAMREGHYCLCW